MGRCFLKRMQWNKSGRTGDFSWTCLKTYGILILLNFRADEERNMEYRAILQCAESIGRAVVDEKRDIEER